MQRIKHYPCPAHPGNHLSLVCTDKQCVASPLICPLCEFSAHTSHVTIPIKLMLSQVSSATSKEDITVLDVSLFLDRSHKECLREVYRFEETLLNVSKTLSKAVDDYYLNVKSQLKSFAEQQVPINLILDTLNVDTEKSELQAKIAEILKSYYFNSNGTAQKLNLYSAVMKATENQIQQLNDKLQELQSQLDKKVEVISNQFRPSVIQPTCFSESLSQTITFTFSSTLKGANIVVSNNRTVAEQKTSESNGQRFIICEPAIPKVGITKYAFKIIKYTGWIGVGLCHKDLIVSANYKFHYTNIGHGSYLISNNAYSWSHLQKDLNSAHKSFDFAANDVIIVEVDIAKKKVTWSKKKATNKFVLIGLYGQSMDIDVTQELYPCANLCSPGDTVEVLNKID